MWEMQAVNADLACDFLMIWRVIFSSKLTKVIKNDILLTAQMHRADERNDVTNLTLFHYLHLGG